MARITIDGKQIECRDGINVLQAALEAGFDIPHYCYHPGLAVVASCRLCLMEMKMPNPKTKDMEWAPKLVPSCQTPVRDGMEVRFNSPAVKGNQEHVMEYYLVNHPLDCPVCDKAGECYLQDYSYHFGKASSRVVDPKHKNPKKDIGPRTLLYQDRCVLCSRCVRFAREVAGSGELCIVNRGHKAEIDVFPGLPLANPLQGNVVDLCPVGALLDKDFLFAQRVWFLRGHNSVCRGCSTGCAIRADENEQTVYRLRPRWNPGVNDWWTCDEGRFGWKFVHDENRIRQVSLRRGSQVERPTWEALPDIVRLRFAQVVQRHGAASVAVQLSPEMSCEEAWLLASWIRSIAPEATLALGDVQVVGEDQRFPSNAPETAPAKFVIRAEKNPNRRGIEAVLAGLGGNVATREELAARAGKGEFKALWVAGGYPKPAWPTKELLAGAAKAEFLVAQDIFESGLTAAAHLVLPSCAWLEREGTFMNAGGLIQPFEAAIRPPEGVQADGQYLWSIAGQAGLFRAARVRELMAPAMPAFASVHVPPQPPEHQH
jgi:NADH-quinone oxidoreductase subunit G